MLLKEIGVPIPVPSDLLMVGAGVQIATGAYSLVALLLALAVAVFIGASIQYFLARSAGRAVVYRLPPAGRRRARRPPPPLPPLAPGRTRAALLPPYHPRAPPPR